MSQPESFATLLRARASCRGFLSEPVAHEVIAEVLRDAQHVPSWCNSQPWQVTACGAEETARLAAALYEHVGQAGHASDIAFPSAYEDEYKARRRECGWQLYEAVGIEKGDRVGSAAQMRENFRLFGAPHFLLITTPRALGPYGVLDCGAFVTAVLLGLEARGLGGIAMASVAGFAPFMRDWFDVGDDRDVLCGIALGHPDRDAAANRFRTTRAPEGEVVTWR